MYSGIELCLALCAVKGEAGLWGSAVPRFEGGGYLGVASPPVCKGKLFNQPSSKEGGPALTVASPVPPRTSQSNQWCSRRHVEKYI